MASDYPRPLGAARVPRPRLSDAIAADNPIRRDLTAAIKVLEHAQRGHVRESEAIALALELLWGIE